MLAFLFVSILFFFCSFQYFFLFRLILYLSVVHIISIFLLVEQRQFGSRRACAVLFSYSYQRLFFTVLVGFLGRFFESEILMFGFNIKNDLFNNLLFLGGQKENISCLFALIISRNALLPGWEWWLTPEPFPIIKISLLRLEFKIMISIFHKVLKVILLLSLQEPYHCFVKKDKNLSHTILLLLEWFLADHSYHHEEPHHPIIMTRRLHKNTSFSHSEWQGDYIILLFDTLNETLCHWFIHQLLEQYKNMNNSTNYGICMFVKLLRSTGTGRVHSCMHPVLLPLCIPSFNLNLQFLEPQWKIARFFLLF